MKVVVTTKSGAIYRGDIHRLENIIIGDNGKLIKGFGCNVSITLKNTERLVRGEWRKVDSNLVTIKNIKEVITLG